MDRKLKNWRAKRILAAVSCLICFSLFLAQGTYVTAFAQEQRVFDQAGLFRETEKEELEAEIDEIGQTVKMDFVVVTTADAQGKSVRAYADDFYDEGGFGTGTEASGMLFLIDMDNREICISTAGTMQRFLTDDRIENMLDHAYDRVRQGDYAGAASQVLEEAAAWYHKGIPGGQYLYDEDTGRISRYHSIRWYEAAIAFLAAGACGFAACQNVRREYEMKQEHQRAAGYLMAYRANAQFSCHQRNDTLINSYVSQQIIPRPSGGSGGSRGGGVSGGARSTVHRSSSGRSHGGGSRKF